MADSAVGDCMFPSNVHLQYPTAAPIPPGIWIGHDAHAVRKRVSKSRRFVGSIDGWREWIAEGVEIFRTTANSTIDEETDSHDFNISRNMVIDLGGQIPFYIRVNNYCNKHCINNNKTVHRTTTINTTQLLAGDPIVPAKTKIGTRKLKYMETITRPGSVQVDPEETMWWKW